jgi:manganese-transporting P-type ATPase
MLDPFKVPLKTLLNQANKGLTTAQFRENLAHFGLNQIEITIPAFSKILIEQLLTPIPLFQFFCCLLWLLEDDYWKYMIFTVLSIVGMEMSTVIQKRKNLLTLEQISNRLKSKVEVKRDNTWCIIDSSELVPFDLIKLKTTGGTLVVPADILVIEGSPVVNESSLTGESIPQMKSPIDFSETSSSDSSLEAVSKEGGSMVFSGTTLLQNEVVGVVLRTGQKSSHGELLEMIKSSQKQIQQNRVDTFRVLIFLLSAALFASGYLLYQRLTGKGPEKLLQMTNYKFILRLVMIITSVVPPELPMQMALAVNAALLSLQKSSIMCTEPSKVTEAGNVQVVLFDKTGTLTSDQLGLVTKLDNESLMISALCHSLVSVEGQGLCGDPIELAIFNSSVASYDASKQTATFGNNTFGKILHRYTFNSQLKRMSCFVSVNDTEFFSVVKGSPESIKSLLVDVPKTYDADYEVLAKQGKRVLALAYRKFGKHPPGSSVPTRIECESKLVFAGFVAFACITRSDTKLVINALRDANIKSVMVTGDAVLTAIHVAKEVGIVYTKDCDVLHPDGSWASGAGKVGSDLVRQVKMKAGDNFGLVTCGDTLDKYPELYEVIEHFNVLARMNPKQKEQVVNAYNAKKWSTCFCGDGGNDVGALKASNVGLALLGGFGDTNTGQSPAAAAGEQEDANELLMKDAKIKKLLESENQQKYKAAITEKRNEITAKYQQQWLQEELAKYGGQESAGVSGYFNAVKNVTMRINQELQAYNKTLQQQYGIQSTWTDSTDPSTASPTSAVSVSIGDASIAAPFTSRLPSVRSLLEIIKQGRCTLLIAVQQMQIMMMESLISAFTFAAVTMEGGKTTELQLIFSGVLVLVASISFNYAKPSNKLAKQLPLNSVFHPGIFVSVLFQVLLHLSVMMYSLNLAKSAMGETALADLYKFESDRDNKITSLLDSASSSEGDSSDFSTILGTVDYFKLFKSVPYHPNLLNTVMFLVKTSQQVAVLIVNYKGSPWMMGMSENIGLFLSSFICVFGLFICSSGYIPILNEYLELMILPNELRNQVLVLLVISSLGALLIDRLILYIFAKDIFMASTYTPLVSIKFYPDLYNVAVTCFKYAGLACLVPLVLANPLFMIMGWYGYRQYSKYLHEKDMKLLQEYRNSRGAGRNNIKQD